MYGPQVWRYSKGSAWIYSVLVILFRSSRSQMFFKIGVVKDFTNFAEKHLKACNFLKKRLQHRCFHVKSAKFFKGTFFYRAPPVAAYSFWKASIPSKSFTFWYLGSLLSMLAITIYFSDIVRWLLSLFTFM